MKRLLSVTVLAALASACGAGQTAEPLQPNQDPGTLEKKADTAPTPAPAEPPSAPELRLPDGVSPLLYMVNLTVDPNSAEFTGDVRINIEVTKPTRELWLHGTDLKVTSAQLKTASGIQAMNRLAVEDDQFIGYSLGAELPVGQYWLEMTYTGAVSEKDYSGLFRQKDGDSWYLYSQLEAYSARRVLPSFDEPRWKVPFTVSLTVPANLKAFSNTPKKSEIPAKEGWKTVVFQTSKPLPTYLLAIAVGDFETIDVGTAGRNKTPVRIIVPRGKTAKAGFARTSVVALQEKLEGYFDMAYPYRKLDHIAVPHFLGAMENPGLITYDSGILLAEKGKEGRAFQRRHANVVAHELAHQWFGDLVTLAWWDDTWLNESFATWLAAKVVDQWQPGWKGEVRAAAGKDGVMKGDSLISARKIRQPITNHGDISAAFDSITYGKGSAVLAMFERSVGEDAFQRGVRDYIRTNAWKTATADDFLAAIAKVSDPVIPDAFRSFLDQPGVPVVAAKLSCNQGMQAPTVSLTQERYLPTGSTGSAAQTWKLPICVKYPADPRGKKILTKCDMLTEASKEIVLTGGDGCPAWLLANADAAGYYRVAYDAGGLDALLKKGANKLTAAERISLIGDLNALVQANKVGVGDALTQVPRLLKDKNPFVVENAIGIVGQLSDHLVPARLRPNRARFVRKTFGPTARKLGWQPNKGDSDETKRLRSRVLPLVAVVGEDKALRKQAAKLARSWLATGKGIDTEDVAEVLSTAAADGDAALWQQIWDKAQKTQDKRQQRSLITAMGAFRDPALVTKNLQLFLDNKDLDMRASFSLLGGAMEEPANRQMIYDWVKANHVAIMDKLPRMARGYVVFVTQAFCDQAHYDDAKAFFGPIVAKELQGEKLLKQSLESMQLCMAFVKAQQPTVEKFLGNY